MTDYLIAKSIHIIFVVSYFAGLFYMVRLFIYHTEALEKDDPERSILHKQFSFMEERLWNIITVPALVLMTLSGLYMLYDGGDCTLIKQGWFHVKLLFVVFLFVYHYYSWRIMKRLQAGRASLTSVQLRMLNEVATIILFVVVFAVILKGLFITYWYFSLIAFVVMGALIMLVVKLVNKGKN
ncbi:CopD family protein [Capnocytophaga sp. oral taxon 902]|uniref:CopD family protein n=1 Tax=Capnocytophaga sp. oral taxon 902 TaxID=2748316 RepID=UPI0015BF4709|nr:CopD family protein [Capnocytophaga sp. oral taxon 902]QLF50766.1 CopD family protein [Capnocytophaga sp. oral taxon 902]